MAGEPTGRPRAWPSSASTPRTSRSRRAALLAARARRRGGRLRRAACRSDHFSPWSERQGESGFAWSWLGAALQRDRAAVRRRQRAGTALPPGDRRPGGRDAVRDVPRPAVGRARHRRGSNEHITGEPLAAQGDRATRGCASASTSCARCSPARRSTTTGSCASTARSCGRCPAEPPPLLGAAVSEETARWGGEWADGLVTVNAPRRARCERMLDAFRERGGAASVAPGAPVAGRRPRRRRCGSRTTSGARTSSRRRCAGTSTRVEEFDEAARHVRPEDVRGAVLISVRPRAARRVAAASSPTLGFDDDRPAPRRPGPATRSSTRSASTSSRGCDERQGHQRPVVEERGRLLPRRRDVPRRRRRRLRRPRRA